MTAFDEDDVLGKAYDARLMRRFFRYVRPHRRLFVFCLFLVLGGVAAELVLPFLLHAVIDGPVAEGDTEGFWLLGGLFLAAVTAAAFFKYAQHYFSNLGGQRIIHDIRNDTFRHLQRLPVSFYDRNPVGRLLTRVTNDVESLSELFSSGLIALAADVLLIVGIVIVMFVKEWRLALLTLLAAPVLVATALAFRRFARDAFREARRAIARLNAYLNESVGGVKTIQIFNREETCAQRFEERNREYRERSILAVFLYSMFWPGVELVSTGAVALLIWYAAGEILSNTMTFGTFLAFWYCVQKFFEPARELAEKYAILQSAMASSERIFKLLDTPATIAAPALPATPSSRGEIVFDHVGFSYDGKTPVLEDVSFRVRPGENIAVVGYTGAGKTTLLHLLLRLYDVTSGRILVDGHDVRDQDPRELRRRFGLVLQDNFLFSGTVEENIRLGEKIPDERLKEALRIVKAERILDRLPDGIRTPVRERGSALSSGERQLLSLARALAFDPPILLLDEATSNVDAETEGLIQEALQHVMEGRTAITVAHRLSTIRSADRILVLHQGRLSEEGDHATLLREGGVYGKLYRLQWQPA